jgi:hypothetical protein
MIRYSAREIHQLVVDVFAAGQPNWPVSRAALRGLRLRQVSDAIRIWVTQVYICHLAGTAPEGLYASLKENWLGLSVSIPIAFTRIDDWEAAQRITDPSERWHSLISRGCHYLEPTEMNDEEKDYHDGETFSSFIGYLETLPTDYPGILDHILGRLSGHRYIYIDATVPVLPSNSP